MSLGMGASPVWDGNLNHARRFRTTSTAHKTLTGVARGHDRRAVRWSEALDILAVEAGVRAAKAAART